MAKTVRDGATPEYSEKVAHLQQLSRMRGDYVKQINDIKGSNKGLDVRSEAELDARVAELESRIQVIIVSYRHRLRIRLLCRPLNGNHLVVTLTRSCRLAG